MNSTPRVGWTVAEWQAAYHTQCLDPQALLDWVSRFPKPDPAWISVANDQQLDEQLRDLSRRSRAVGDDRSKLPLFGVPFAVKDNIDVAGFETTAACPAFAYLAARDAEVVGRLRAAGAIVVGKTNMDQFATGLVGTRSPYGVVPNSFDARYIAGGSSSGSGSVVARGLVPLALGTDTAGSGRVPAAFNNVVGWKPTRGGWSTSGVVPACRTLDCVSVFTLTVADAELVARIVEGFDPSDPYSRRRPANTTANTSLGRRPRRLAIPDELDFAGDALAQAAFDAALVALCALDAQLEKVDFEPFRQLARLLYEGPWVAERLTVVEPLLLAGAERIDTVVAGVVRQGDQFSAAQAFRVEYRRAALARAIELTLEGFDALVVPTTPTTFTIDAVAAEPIATNSRLGTYTNFTNLADLCALAVPGPFRDDGLPAGITLLAPAWREWTLAALGRDFEGSLALPRGATRRPFTPAARSDSPASKPPVFDLAVVGAHLSGLALNSQLQELNATLVKATRTSANYKLYLLPGSAPLKPGMLRETGGAPIDVEIWRLSSDAYARFVAAIPSPLGVGNVELEDGSWVKGFLCEPFALTGATEITQFGGFRQYLARRS